MKRTDALMLEFIPDRYSGALHLYGEKGVLALLEADGYRATRVYQ